jgi:hypothetical protein
MLTLEQNLSKVLQYDRELYLQDFSGLSRLPFVQGFAAELFQLSEYEIVHK